MIKYFKAGLIVLFITAISMCSQPADAKEKVESMRGDVSHERIAEVADSNNWYVSVGGATGVTIDGEQYSILDAIVETPPDAPPFFQLLPSKSWHRYVVTPAGNEINITRFEYPLGDSNNFFGAAYRDADDVGIGVTYVPEHWGQDWLDGISFSGFIREGGKYMFAADSDYPVASGYGINAHLMYYFGDSTYIDEDGDPYPHPDRLNGTIGFYHNFVPDGSLRGEVGYAMWTSIDSHVETNEDFWYFIIKGTL